VRGAPGGEQVEVVLNRSRRVGLEVAGLEGRSLLWAIPADRGAAASCPLVARHAWVFR